ncbi:MAG: Ig-like domain-containing protein [Clostridia bacterium]|nr:Ig-like domain-containing protein [Clostridia bacterium]
MSMKKLFALLLALSLLLCGAAAAEESYFDVPDMLRYQGGIVTRGSLRKTAALSGGQLDLAYAMTNAPYVRLGEETVWEVVLSGGEAPYTCMALLAYQADLTMDQFADPWSTQAYFEVTKSPFGYTFDKAGRYFWEFRITDAAGQYLTFQTRIFETYTEADETDSTTSAGKVNSVVSSLITAGMSDYQRARVLHDWLIHNANYDYTYSNYDAGGVLLRGTGVCDSYARAYQMLLAAAGVESMIVSGTAGSNADLADWGAHAWNLVRLGGKWYHVDCTWDDPGEGGYERHTYFCLSDEAIAKDHNWNRSGVIISGDGMSVPEAEGGELETGEETGDYDFTFATTEEFAAGFDALIAAGEYRERTVGLYTGNASAQSVYDALYAWIGERGRELGNQGLLTSYGVGCKGDLFSAVITWKAADDYVRIDEEEIILSEGGAQTVVPAEYYPAANAFTWTSSAPKVASVSASYNTEDGLTAVVTALAAGTAKITVASEDGLSDSFDVIVLPAHAPDFGLALSEEDGGIALTWKYIPGVTEYRVMRVFEGKETCLAVTGSNAVILSAAQLPSDVVQEIYVLGLRVVAGSEAARYASESVEYGTYYDPATCTHGQVDAIPGYAATCTKPGLTEGSRCALCKSMLTEQTAIPALGHTEAIDAAVAATCTATGLTEGRHCSVCKEVLLAQAVVPMIDHTEQVTPAVPPTCTEPGLSAGAVCGVCGKVLREQEEIPATGHTEVMDPEVPATHVTHGLSEGSHCGVCGVVLTEQEETPLAVVEDVLTLPALLKSVEEEAFLHGMFECVIIPEGCESIGARAFAANEMLRFVEIPASVTQIDATAFEGSAAAILVAPAGSYAAVFAEANDMLCIPR